MGYLVKINGLLGFYEPVDKKAEPIKVGEYLRLPDGRVFLFEARNPKFKFVQMNADPSGGYRIVEFQKFSK
jgi:hypothetical protein